MSKVGATPAQMTHSGQFSSSGPENDVTRGNAHTRATAELLTPYHLAHLFAMWFGAGDSD
jgi:hypothetical protein